MKNRFGIGHLHGVQGDGETKTVFFTLMGIGYYETHTFTLIVSYLLSLNAWFLSY